MIAPAHPALSCDLAGEQAPLDDVAVVLSGEALAAWARVLLQRAELHGTAGDESQEGAS